ncbi:MAG TPA: cation:proton antiporter [Anaerolineae bacterium]|nr:cation:proton antiporter [Anaerolineae bacterium]
MYIELLSAYAEQTSIGANHMTLIWILAAFVMGIIAKKLNLPTLVGYLTAGFLLALGGLQSNVTIEAIGDLGVVLLLFTVGLHINFRSLIQIQVVGVGLLHLIISTIFFALVLTLWQLPIMAIFLIAVSLSFSSTILTAKTMENRNELDSYHGRLAIGILILQDMVAVFLLAIAGGGAPTWWALALLGLPILRPVLLYIMYEVGRDELLVIYGLLLALGMGWLFDIVGLDAKLGALIAGMLIAGDTRSDELYEKLWGLKEIFLVGFFLQVGLTGLPDRDGWIMVGSMLLLLPLKGILFFFLIVGFNLRARTAFLSSISLTAYSEFALIVTATAAKSNLVDAEFAVMIGILVALSYALNAPVSRVVNQLWQRFEPSLLRFERDVRHPDHEPRSLGATDYVVLGMGQAGTAAYDYLVSQGKRPLGLDADPAQIQNQLQLGRRVIYGDANDPDLWTGLDLSHVEAVLVTVSNTSAEVNAVKNLRAERFTGFIAALLARPESRTLLEQAGVTISFLPIAQAGRELAQASLGQTTAPTNSLS